MTWGLFGRVVLSVAAVIGVPWFSWWFMNVFAVIVLAPYSVFVMPWILRDVWRPVRVRVK